MNKPALLLMNCRRCDDVVKLVDKMRTCECGTTCGRMRDNGSVETTGAPRVFAIDWESYDGIDTGEKRPFTMLSRDQIRTK